MNPEKPEERTAKGREGFIRRITAGNEWNSEYAKLPPQARDIEEVVLGALMIEESAMDEVIDILRPESFYVDAHQLIFEAMRDCHVKHIPVDMLTVVDQLRKNDNLERVGGAVYISQLTNKVGSAANVAYHATIISEKHIQRQLISTSSTIIKDAYEDSTDVFELLDKAEKNLFAIAESHLRNESEDLATLISAELTQLSERMQNPDNEELNGVKSGFTKLDEKTNGWQRSDLIIVAARPAMGKTAFTLALARNAAVDYRKPVAVFSLEMSSSQLVQRLISMETEIKGDSIRSGKLQAYEYQHLTARIDRLKSAKIFIDDTASISVFDLRSKCRRLKYEHDIQMVVIDYLQLMTAGGDRKTGNREQEISMISRSLKALAKELNIPVIALSQLSRLTETRGGDKRPILSDLRESGAIEQDADMVMFLYRPEYYKITEDPETKVDLRGVAEVIIAKHRNGDTGTIRVRFQNQFAKFGNLEEDYLQPPSAGIGAPQIKVMPSKFNQEPDDFSAEKDHPGSDMEDAPF